LINSSALFHKTARTRKTLLVTPLTANKYSNWQDTCRRRETQKRAIFTSKILTNTVIKIYRFYQHRPTLVRVMKLLGSTNIIITADRQVL